MTQNTSPPPPWSATDKNSFAYESTAKRWPEILAGAISALYQASFALSYSSTDQAAKIDEAKAIIEKLSLLKHDIGRDKALQPIGSDGGADASQYDEVIAKEKWTWFSAPWLFAECYLYRLIRTYFARSSHWQTYDPFGAQKVSAFRSSGKAINQLATTVEELVNKTEAARSQGEEANGSAAADSEGQRLIFHLLAQSSLWGNATDLSLLTSLTHADIQTLQSNGLSSEAQAAKANMILTGTQPLDEAWKRISSAKNGRLDIVLDNSGFEVVTDLLLADWLLATGYITEVVFHPKNIPWFVSDVTPSDFHFTLEALQSPTFFTDVPAAEKESARVARSQSRQRHFQADPAVLAGTATANAPAGSGSLKMSDEEIAARKASASAHPSGSRHLQMREGSLDRTEEEQEPKGWERGRQAGGEHPKGSRSLALDPSYFQSARSRTVSPSRSYVIDATTLPLSFSSLSVAEEAEEDETRGRSRPSSSTTATQRLAARWSSHLASGRFKLLGSPLIDFWTTHHSYASLPAVAPELNAELKKARMVLFKGDLNTRKLLGDLRWDETTPFTDAMGALKGQFDTLVLRTCKADVCAGLSKEALQRAESEDPKWRINGKYAIIVYVPRDE